MQSPQSKGHALFVMDSFKTVLIDRDTTFAFMKEGQRRKYTLYACRIGDLGTDNDKGYAHVKRVSVRENPKRPFEIHETKRIELDSLDLVFMRKDPPFDVDYIIATYLLDSVASENTLVINHPSGLREANEKAFILRYPQLIPPTRVTRRSDDIVDFVAEHDGRCIVKPLDAMGGAGVFLLGEDDPNLTSLIETSTQFGSRHIMCQAYVPESRQGDKRIILIDGEPVGATLRIPKEGELRGNIHVGARCIQTTLTARERQICDALAPDLNQLGLIFVGIDVIGGFLTEVNVTSPTGIQEINRLDDVCLEGQMWDWLERRRC